MQTILKGVDFVSIHFRKEIKNLKPYTPGKPIEDVKREFNLDRVVKLASNENPLGYSEKVKDVLSNSLDSLSIYPDGNATILKEALADKYKVSTKEVLPSSGADEMIDLISKTLLEKNDEVIIADITFPRYMATAKMMDAKPVIVPLKDYTYDLKGMLDAITEKTKLIWLCNPNNPTGTMLTEKEILEFLDRVPSHIVVAYDEAYRDYVTRDDFLDNSIKLIDKYTNLIVMRTFSKAYGLAGLRVGYIVADKNIVENINKARGPFNVNSLAQIAAVAALEDEDFIEEVYNTNLEGKKYFYKELKKMGLSFPPSETNHIYVDVGVDANEIFEEMQKYGVIIRPMSGTFIRISIGTMEENKLCIETLKKVLKK